MADVFIFWSEIIDAFGEGTLVGDTELTINNTDMLTKTVITGTGLGVNEAGFLDSGTITSITLAMLDGTPLQTLTDVVTTPAQIGAYLEAAFNLRESIDALDPGINDPWLEVLDLDTEPTEFTSTLVILPNSDGTFTRITGNGFALNGALFSGTIDEIRRLDTDGMTELEGLDLTSLPAAERALGVGAGALFPGDAGRQAFHLAGLGDNTLTQINDHIDLGGGSFLFNIMMGTDGNDDINGLNPPQFGFGNAVAYFDAPSGITASLVTNTVTGGFGTDTLTNIASVSGSDFDDSLTGSAGSDGLFGNRGNDTINGGMGSDFSGFGNSLALHTVVRNGVLTTVTGPDGTDHLTSIENMNFNFDNLRNIFFTGDFDGANGDDIALQNDSSNTAFWLMDGLTIGPGSGNLPTLGNGWVAIGAGDLSGNGTDDLVLQNGQDLALWQMNGTTVDVGSGNIGTLGAGWMVTGIADLGGDGNDDLVLQNGQTLAVWQMTGTTIGPGSGNIGTLGAGWAVAGTGDFNDDGNDDLLLQNGQNLALWEMNGTSILPGSGNIGTLGSGWMVAGVADTDGDGNADVILQNGQTLAVWLMDGTAIQPGTGNIGTLGAGWTIAGNGDFNHDGMADLLLQSGSILAEWHLNGTAILGTSGNVGGTLGGGWDLL